MKELFPSHSLSRKDLWSLIRFLEFIPYMASYRSLTEAQKQEGKDLLQGMLEQTQSMDPSTLNSTIEREETPEESHPEPILVAPVVNEEPPKPVVLPASNKKEEEKPGMDVEKKPEITYDDFAKLQFQIGEIVKCEEVPKSKKLLCSQVKIGSETRQILSGIKAWYKPEDMVGRKVMVVTNLKPAKLAGMLSEGMILCAEDDEGNLALMTPAKDIKSGSEVC